MLIFIIRRLLHAPLLVFGVALVTFVVFNVVGGNPVYTLAGKNASPKHIHDLTKEYGFDRPLFVDADFLWRGWHEAELKEAASDLESGSANSQTIRQLGRSIDDLYDELDLMGAEDFDASTIESLRDRVVAAGITVAEQDGADPESRLQDLSGSVLQETRRQAAEAQQAIQTLRDHLRLAVPELVELALSATERETRVLATYELDSLVYEGFAVDQRDSQSTVDSKMKALAAWWQENQKNYSYSFDFGGTLKSIFHSQFANYLVQSFTFQFGDSYKHKKPVGRIILEGAPASLKLTVPAFIFGTALAIAIGLISAFYQGRLVDRIVVIVSVMGMSVSILVFIILAQVFLAHRLGWFPVQGYEKGLAGMKYFFLPWIIWIAAGFGADVRFFRTAMVDELMKDYIRTARAKGLSHVKVMFKHLLMNAMIPILTYVIIALPYLYTGSLLIEKYFSIPGLGKVTVDAVLDSDFPLIRAMTLIGSIFYILADIVTNVAYAVVDPRVRLDG